MCQFYGGLSVVFGEMLPDLGTKSKFRASAPVKSRQQRGLGVDDVKSSSACSCRDFTGAAGARIRHF